jgi:predicted AAA+ superfamily ATPase
MITRNLYAKVEKTLKRFPAVAILGPRQVGKTTLIKQLTKKIKGEVVYLDLEKDSDYNRLNRDAEDFLSNYIKSTVVLDEIQRMPKLFVLLRPLIDENRKPLRYLITGSASPELLKGATESLAGRISYLYLYPVNVAELPDKINVQQHWLRGGFPVALTASSNDYAFDWLGNFITNYIERDLPFLFDVRFSPVIMKKLWQMMSHWQSNIINMEDFARSLSLGATTIKRYLDYLEGAFIIHRLPPFHINISKRLVKASKLYILDSGILHRLLHINSVKELAGHPMVGASWEGYVVSQLIYNLPSHLTAYYYRTHDGAECDVVLAQGHIVKCCIEIKLGKAPTVSKGFYQSLKDLKCKNAFVICAIEQGYKNREGTNYTNLTTFLFTFLSKI